MKNCFSRFVSHGSILLFFLLASAPALSNAPQLPNVVIFILDDVGQSDVGVFGNPVVKTPNIDTLAAEGMHFTNAFLTTSSCSPSRASILTGLYPSATGAPNLHDPVPANKTSLPQLLRQAGYYTASVGKWHLGEPFKNHFDRVVEPREESGAADWLPELARRPADKPFFFWLASKDAHEPFYWRPPLRHQSPETVIVPYYANDDMFTRKIMAGYYDEIARADDNIGAVIRQLRRENILDNTLVIVLSDNGALFGGAKTTLYDEGIKTPLVMRFPPVIASNITNLQLVSAVDIMPTVLALAGVPSVAGAPGVSLLPTLENPLLPVRSYIYAERNKHGQPKYSRVIRTQEYLYKRNYLDRKLCDPMADTLWDPDQPRNRRHAEFYDLQRDPHATQNRLMDPAYRVPLNIARQRLNNILHDTAQKPPSLVMEQCDPRALHERIAWPLPEVEE